MKLQVAINLVDNFLIEHNADIATVEAFKQLAAYAKGIETKSQNGTFQMKQAPAPGSLPTAVHTGKRAYGMPWTGAEEAQLLREFDSKMPSADIASAHHRTIEAIAARLVKLGRLKSREELPGYAEYRESLGRKPRENKEATR